MVGAGGSSAASSKQKKQQISSSSSSSFLKKGSVVEVSTEEEGFKDAWFVATVIKPPSPLSNPPPSSRPGPKSSSSSTHHQIPNQENKEEEEEEKSDDYDDDEVVYVEYKTLLNDKNPSKPLREYVHVRFARPLPPTDHTPPSSFELNHVVDAYYRDGWWTGVITRLLPGPRFILTFRNPLHEIQFGPSDLRLHLDWVNGSWLRPPKQAISGLMYSVGKKVEVLLDKEDVWFPATIVEDPGTGSFLVEHQIPDDPHRRTVTVDYSNIRPCPPLVKDKGFELLEKVDALYDFGWRIGLITQELADNRYKVFFRDTNDTRELHRSEIRTPVRWKEDKWFTYFGDVVIPHHEKHEGLVHSDLNGTNMDVPNGSLYVSEGNTEGKKSKEKPAFPTKPREDQDKKLSSADEESLNVTTSPKKRARYPASDSNKACFQPFGKSKKGVDYVIRSLITSQKKATASVKQSEGMVSDFNSPPSNSTRANLHRGLRSGDQPSNNPSQGRNTEKKRRKIVEDGYHTPSSKTNPGRFANLPSKKRRSSLGSLECIKTSGSRAEGSRKLHDDESLKPKEDVKQQRNNLSVDNKELRAGESSQKRPRGRPKKVLIRSLETPVTEQNGDNGKEGVIVKECITSDVDTLTTAAATGMVSFSVEGSAPQEVFVTQTGDGEKVIDDQQRQNKELGNSMKMPPAQMPSEKMCQGLTKQLERYSSKRSKRRMASLNQNSVIQGASGGKTAEYNCSSKEASMVVEEGPNNMLDDQPLSKWFEEMHSPGNVDGARVSPARNVDQSTDLSKKHKLVTQSSAGDDEGINASLNEVITQSPAVDKIIGVSSEPENLPFVKNTTLWATVERMEAFQKMPQKPHFRPLQKCKESSREGLAIASMVTFCSAVEKISKLQFDDPREKIEDILDSLNDLEAHGFDVQILRDRIAELLSIQGKRKKIDGEVMEINSQIVTCNLEKAEKDEEIAQMMKQIQELQEKIVVAESVKEMKDGEIGSFQKKLLDLEQSLNSGRSTFEGLAGGVL